MVKKKRIRFGTILAGLAAIIAVFIFVVGENSIRGFIRSLSPGHDVRIVSYSTYFTHAPSPDTIYLNHGRITAVIFEPVVKITNYSNKPLVINEFGVNIYPVHEIDVISFQYPFVFSGTIEELEANTFEDYKLTRLLYPILVPQNSETIFKLHFRLCFRRNDSLIILGDTDEEACRVIPEYFGIPSHQQYCNHTTWNIILDTNRGEIHQMFTELIPQYGKYIRLRENAEDYGILFDSVSS